ncbi:hypothetical protein BS47DRAFT_845626 [Hydnum rufescens UP504]|uniref:Uncharacterized protein n=1 Tax=Hydnum rufescens UP504 TaxID=1448309 RepID=A0A9P6BCE4_9AGAM|nr:hypothetical protein BS47DRAFT_845626 [Hydnum rufescens UP504]
MSYDNHRRALADLGLVFLALEGLVICTHCHTGLLLDTQLKEPLKSISTHVRNTTRSCVGRPQLPPRMQLIHTLHTHILQPYKDMIRSPFFKEKQGRLPIPGIIYQRGLVCLDCGFLTAKQADDSAFRKHRCPVAKGGKAHGEVSESGSVLWVQRRLNKFLTTGEGYFEVTPPTGLEHLSVIQPTPLLASSLV